MTPAREYGNTPAEVRGFMLVGASVPAFVLVLIAHGAATRGEVGLLRWGPFFAILVGGVSAGTGIAWLATNVTQVRITDEQICVEHFRVEFRRVPIGEYAGIRGSRLAFKTERAASLIGMYVREVDRLSADLAKLTSGCCRRCGYDLRATPDRCPECGEPRILIHD